VAKLQIGDYAMIGDCHTAALVGRNGSIDWLCLPRFDSSSIFGALLGDEDQGRWLLAPAAAGTGASVSVTRHYLEDTFILVTRWTTSEGEVEVTDLMPQGDRRADVVRRVRGIRGSVPMHMDLRIRFGYASALPWVRQMHHAGDQVLVAAAGPDAIVVRGVKLTARDHAHTADFTVSADETVDIVLTWYPAHRAAPEPFDVDARIEHTVAWWRNWASTTMPSPVYREQVRRSLLVLRALTHEDTGGIAAAVTTSLPEQFGGERNWDYRYVWLRDASQTLHVLLEHGFVSEADAWRNWLLRAIAGDPADVQIMYGLSGERRLDEWVVPTLPGYDGASPVRVGNAAYAQFQGDVFGEVMLALQAARELGAHEADFSWPLQRALMAFVEEKWRHPDHGLWEIRGRKRHFTHSKAMMWAAFDCAVKAVRDFGLHGPLERWEGIRDSIAAEIEAKGFDRSRNTYTQYFGSTAVDASLLQLAQIGYIAPDDPRMLGTVAAIESELLVDGLLLRYRTETGVDGLPAGENTFLACSFWLVGQYARSGRVDDARTLMDRLVGYANDVGLMSEEYDVAHQRHAGNMPQALTHLALVRAADAIAQSIAT
jgi:GH15 family glucan-1,4-alpha-glucosidase